MTFTTDTELRGTAEKALAEAQDIMGWAIDGLFEVGAEDYWADLADRAKRALDRARQVPKALGRKAAAKVATAARSGLDAASSASDTARGTLADVASTAVAFAAGLVALPPLLLLLGAYVVLEGSGQARSFRATTQQHYRTQAKRGKELLGAMGARYGF